MEDQMSAKRIVEVRLLVLVLVDVTAPSLTETLVATPVNPSAESVEATRSCDPSETSRFRIVSVTGFLRPTRSTWNVRGLNDPLRLARNESGVFLASGALVENSSHTRI